MKLDITTGELDSLLEAVISLQVHLHHWRSNTKTIRQNKKNLKKLEQKIVDLATKSGYALRA
jgi:hypothetical protein